MGTQAGTNQVQTKAAENSGKLLVDRIMYLVSLVSDPVAVDPMLDILRRVTAHTELGSPLSAGDRQQLAALEAKLKDYLIHNDPVRSFTADSLEQNLRKYFAGSQARGFSVKRQFGTVIGLTLLCYGIAVAALGSTSPRKALLTMSPVALTVLNFGIAWFFWSARKDYAHEIRAMYGYFSAGVIIRSLALVQFPILLVAPHLQRLLAFHYVGFLPPFILMSLTFYAGMVLYARQLKLKTIFMSVWSVLGGGLVLSVIIFLLSHPVYAGSPVFFNISLASFLLSAFFSVPAAVLAFTVARRITPRYAQSVRLLGASQIMFAVGCLCFSSVLLVVSGAPTRLEVGLTALSFVVPEVLLLLSAYNAKRTVNEVR